MRRGSGAPCAAVLRQGHLPRLWRCYCVVAFCMSPTTPIDTTRGPDGANQQDAVGAANYVCLDEKITSDYKRMGVGDCVIVPDGILNDLFI